MSNLQSSVNIARRFRFRLSPRTSLHLTLLLAIVVGLVIAGGQEFRYWRLIILWSGAFLSMGVTVGFLFGVVATRRQSPAVGSSEVPSAINANLESIADWLTKIFIGFALINLKDIPSELGRLTAHVAQGLRGREDEPFVTALVIYFGTVGSLSGYLLTRFYIHFSTRKSGADSLAHLTETLETALERKIDRALRGPIMVNYEGVLCMTAQCNGNACEINEGKIAVSKDRGEVILRAWVQSEPPRHGEVTYAEVVIRDGEDEAEAEFEVRVDSDDLRADKTRQVLRVLRGEISAKVSFHLTYDFLASGARFGDAFSTVADENENGHPQRPEHPLWLMLFQQNRLVQTIALDVSFRGANAE
jgi:hypothetical protein